MSGEPLDDLRRRADRLDYGARVVIGRGRLAAICFGIPEDDPPAGP